MRNFEYFETRTIEETISLLTEYGKDAKVLAGGTDLIPLMVRGMIEPRYVINIKSIPDLSAIEQDNGNGLKIGALATIRSIQKERTIRVIYPILFEAARVFGTVQVRNMATIGGNLCRASPAADMAVALLALNAKTTLAGSKGRRVIPLQEFFTGPGRTALENDEILTQLNVPGPRQHTAGAFLKMGRTAEDLAKISVAVTITSANHFCEDAKIALGAVAPTPIRATNAEENLRGKRISDDLINETASVAAAETRPITDVRSTAEYRKEVSRVLVKRAIKRALKKVA